VPFNSSLGSSPGLFSFGAKKLRFDYCRPDVAENQLNAFPRIASAQPQAR
jgi:hypothetical protein